MTGARSPRLVALVLTHLHKELAEHVAILGFAAVLGPLVVLAVRVTLDDGQDRALALMRWLPSLCAMLVAVALAADAVPAEQRRGTVALLRRLPRGLDPALAGKVIAIVVAAAAVLGVGTLLGALLVVCGRDAQDVPVPSAWQVALLAALAAWTLAFGCQVSRPGVALLVTGVALVLALAPAMTALGPPENVILVRAWRDEPLDLWIVAALGTGVAVVSFAGYAHGGGPRRACCVGLPLALLASAPVWPGYALWIGRSMPIDPQVDTFRIAGASPGPDGARLCVAAYDERYGFQAQRQHFLVEARDGSWSRVDHDPYARRRSDGFDLPDGRRVRATASGLETTRADGTLDAFALPEPYRPAGPRGFGVWLWGRRRLSLDQACWWDSLERTFLPAVVVDDGDVIDVFETATRQWLVATVPADAMWRPAPACDWRFYDPHQRRPGATVPGLQRADQIREALPGGAMLVQAGLDGPCFVVDPATGRRDALALTGSDDVGGQETWSVAGHTPQGRIVVQSRWSIARLDVEARRLVVCPHRGRLIACLDEDTLWIHTDRTIERVHFTGPDHDLLFPRKEEP